MIDTFLFGIILHVSSEHYRKTIKSILKDEDFFLKNIKLVIVDTRERREDREFLQELEEKYLGNVTYVDAQAKSRIGAYNEGLLHCKAKYVHFTTSEIIYRKGTFKSAKSYSDQHAVEVFGIHTKFVSDIEKIADIEDYKESHWDFKENLSYLPLYLNRYFIKYTTIKDRRFDERFQEDAQKQFMIYCFENQSELDIVGNTLLYYCEPQERNLTTYEGKKEKWWYIPQMRDMLIPLLESYDGEIPLQIQNLVYYMIRMKFYHNMNSRYEYALNYDEVKIFLKYTVEALQYIDDSMMKSVKNIVVTPKFMTYYFLKLKYGGKEFCPEIKKDTNEKLAFYIGNEPFALLEDMVVSLQRFATDRETKERQIDADWFYHYLIQNSQCETKIEVNGKPAIIEMEEKNAKETCFGKTVRHKFRFTIHIPKEDRKFYNRLSFRVIIRGEEHVIKAKYARRKLVGRLQTKIKQGRLAGTFQRIANAKYVILYGIGKMLFRQRKNQVVMLSDSRESLSGNLAFIDEELKRKNYEVKYFFKKSLKETKTLREDIQLCQLMASSKYIVLDDFYPIVYPLKIRKNTELIQVWHAMGAFKTVGFSRLGKPGGPSPNSLTHRNYTAAITSAEGIRHNYAEAFGIDLNKVHATGVPRTDIFFDEEYIKRTKQRLYSNYPVLERKKVVLFAPTFRGAGQNSAHYNFEWIDFPAIEKALGDEYVFVVKLHPFIKNTESVPTESEMFLDMTAEREINDLLFVTDVLITDYSSVIFEASLLNVNTVFYVPDLVEYTESRDFYYPFEKYTYGEIAENMEELLCAIKQPANNSEKLEAFKEHFCGACDGHATERLVVTLFDKDDKESKE